MEKVIQEDRKSAIIEDLRMTRIHRFGRKEVLPGDRKSSKPLKEGTTSATVYGGQHQLCRIVCLLSEYQYLWSSERLCYLQLSNSKIHRLYISQSALRPSRYRSTTVLSYFRESSCPRIPELLSLLPPGQEASQD